MSNYVHSELVSDFFRKGQLINSSKGEIIFGNDIRAKGVYYIVSGFVKAYSVSTDGNIFLHIIYGQEEVIPLVWAFTNLQSDEYFECLTKSKLYRLSKEYFCRAIKNDGKLAFEISRQLAYQLKLYSDRLENLEYKSSTERLAYRLLFLASRFGVKRRKSVLIDMPITHETLAQSINLARESVSRELAKLEQKKIIETQKHKITIKKPDELKSLLSKPWSGEYYEHL